MIKKNLVWMVTLLVAIPLYGASSQAADITVKNCSDGRLAVYSFDSGDKGCEHEVDELNLPAGGTGKIICDSEQSCQVALDFVGGQWSYFKCPDIDTKLISEEQAMVICSSRKKGNGFMIVDGYKIVSAGEEGGPCTKLCVK